MKQFGAATVRPKANHRKQRSADVARTRLEPAQDRSRRRNEQILEAAAGLLETVNIENLSHSDIAEAAGISKPSVHYHYPTIAAIQLALGRRYDEEVSVFLAAEQLRNRGRATGWQDMARLGTFSARDWFNARRPACETLLGPSLTRENRLASVAYNSQIGLTMLEGIRKIFVVPENPDLEKVFSYNGEIIDLFWSRSYLTQGVIDDEALEESLRASMGYLRNFLPEVLPRVRAPEADPHKTSD